MILDSVVTGSKENTRAWRKSDTTWDEVCSVLLSGRGSCSFQSGLDMVA